MSAEDNDPGRNDRVRLVVNQYNRDPAALLAEACSGIRSHAELILVLSRRDLEYFAAHMPGMHPLPVRFFEGRWHFAYRVVFASPAAMRPTSKTYMSRDWRKLAMRAVGGPLPPKLVFRDTGEFANALDSLDFAAIRSRIVDLQVLGFAPDFLLDGWRYWRDERFTNGFAHAFADLVFDRFCEVNPQIVMMTASPRLLSTTLPDKRGQRIAGHMTDANFRAERALIKAIPIDRIA